MPWIPNPVYFIVGEWLIKSGAPLLRRTLTKTPPVANILFEGEARLEHGPESVDGLLSLTSDAIVFTPRGIRTRGAAALLRLEDIDEISESRGRILGLIPAQNNGIKLRTRRGIYRFRVDSDDRSAWLHELRAAHRMRADYSSTGNEVTRDDA